MKYLIIFIGFFILSFGNVVADNAVPNKVVEEKNDSYIENIFNNLKVVRQIKTGEELKIDLSNIEKKLKNKYSSEIIFKWDLKGTTTKKGKIFTKKFLTDGDKELTLSIYVKDKKEEKLIIIKKYNLFSYKNKISLIIDSENISQKNIDSYISKSENNGIYVKKILKTNILNLANKNISQNILLNSPNIGNSDNYITVWGDKNYLFSVISKLNKEIQNSHFSKKINLVLISPFNTDVLNNYLRNFVSNKEWINEMLLLPESSMSQIWISPNNIHFLEKSLQNKEYEYVKVNTKSEISEILFISKFINKLSNEGFGNNYIYLIILIPFLLTGISIFKHLFGLSPIGIIIPIILTLLIFQIGLFSTGIILFSLILINLLLGKLTSKYTLLYTPKISFILILNIVLIILILNLLFSYNLINLSIVDSLFVILFVVISERLITIFLSKEFSEYKYNLLNTIIFSLISYFVLSIGTIQTLILAYPEIILILIPINFVIGKFTGLRVTEYFRFKEVIKSIEE